MVIIKYGMTRSYLDQGRVSLQACKVHWPALSFGKCGGHGNNTTRSGPHTCPAKCRQLWREDTELVMHLLRKCPFCSVFRPQSFISPRDSPYNYSTWNVPINSACAAGRVRVCVY